MALFEINSEGKIMTFFDKLISCVWVSVLWMFFSIPIFTIGASTTALYYTVNKVIRHGRSYVWHEFISSFKANFKQATGSFLILLGVGIVLGLDTYIIHQMYLAGEGLGKGYVLFIAFLVMEFCFGMYLFPYMARFDNGFKATFKNTAIIALVNLPKTILMFLILAGCLALEFMCLYYMPQAFFVLMLLMPALSMRWINLIMETVFRKYMSQEDKDTEDDKNGEYPDKVDVFGRPKKRS